MRRQRNGKYNAKKTEIDGIKFASKAEGDYYKYLKKLQSQGVVTRFDLQPKFTLLAGFTDDWGVKHEPIRYIADFLVYYAEGDPKVIDIKGTETPDFKLKRKWYCSKFPLELKLIAHSAIDGGWVETSALKEGRKVRKAEKEALDREILRYLLEENPNITETAKHFGVTKARVSKLANKEAKQ
ncbi:DUF1064 domain-containing protein [Bacillus cereus]